MKHLSFRLLLVACVLVFTGSGFAKKSAPPQKSTSSKKALSYYYWYEQPGDWYYDQQTEEDEINEQWGMYGVLIDEKAGGGTLIATGYRFNTIPHQGPPDIYLYGHFSF